MSKKKYSPDEIIDKLREAEVYLSQGLTVVDEHSRECLLTTAARSFSHRDVIKHLADLFCEKACRCTSAPTTGRSSSPKGCEDG